MPKRKKKVTKYRKPIRINIGIIIFLFIFIYITANVIIYFSKDHFSVYEVVSASIADDNTVTGIILRQEEVYAAEQAGYVNCYVNDGGRAAKHDVIYTIDETGSIYTQLSEAGETETVPEETRKNVQSLLQRYRKDGTERFDAVYTLKDSVLAEVLQSSGSSMLSSLNSILKTYGNSGNFHVNYAKESGIVVFYTDGYEAKTKENITSEDFKAEQEYKKQYVTNSNLLEAGSPVYKLIPSETWDILLPVTEEQYTKLAERDYVDITIQRDGIEATAAVSVYQSQGEYFAQLTLQRYMVRYIGQRFLDITLSLNQVEGLKIPKSAIVEQNFFKVPLEYFTYGGDSNNNGLTKETFSENGEASYTFYDAELYYSDETYGYISTNGYFQAGDRVKLPDSADSYVLSETAVLQGVYNANKGYTVFRRIEPLYENEEYCIVADNTQYGLSEYDHIVLQGDLVTNQVLLR